VVSLAPNIRAFVSASVGLAWLSCGHIELVIGKPAGLAPCDVKFSVVANLGLKPTTRGDRRDGPQSAPDLEVRADDADDPDDLDRRDDDERDAGERLHLTPSSSVDKPLLPRSRS
jgi:hypothetical protein